MLGLTTLYCYLFLPIITSVFVYAKALLGFNMFMVLIFLIFYIKWEQISVLSSSLIQLQNLIFPSRCILLKIFTIVWFCNCHTHFHLVLMYIFFIHLFVIFLYSFFGYPVSLYENKLKLLININWNLFQNSICTPLG